MLASIVGGQLFGNVAIGQNLYPRENPASQAAIFLELPRRLGLRIKSPFCIGMSAIWRLSKGRLLFTGKSTRHHDALFGQTK